MRALVSFSPHLATSTLTEQSCYFVLSVRGALLPAHLHGNLTCRLFSRSGSLQQAGLVSVLGGLGEFPHNIYNVGYEHKVCSYITSNEKDF